MMQTQVLLDIQEALGMTAELISNAARLYPKVKALGIASHWMSFLNILLSTIETTPNEPHVESKPQ